jgi:hypothetical protein
MLGAIYNKLDCAGAVALVSVFIVLAGIAYALCLVTGSLGPSRSPVSTAKRNMLGPSTRKSGEGIKGFTIGPVWVAIVWAVSIAILWAVLTMQPVKFDRHASHLSLFPLR